MAAAAELVLRHGTVWRGRAEGRCAAIAIWRDHVLATGADHATGALVGPATRVADLAGRLPGPGLNDAHSHLLPLGLAMVAVEVRPEVAPTLDELRGRIARAATSPAGREHGRIVQPVYPFA